MSFADEPANQAAPAFTPAGQAQLKSGLLLDFAARCGIAPLALRCHRQQRCDLAVQLCDSVCNGTGAADQVANKTLQIIDQPLLECDDRLDIGLLQFDSAGNAGHECLGIVGNPSNTRTRSRSTACTLAGSEDASLASASNAFN